MNNDNANKENNSPVGADGTAPTAPVPPPRRGRPPKGSKAPPSEPEVIVQILPPNTPNFNAYIRFLAAVANAASRKGGQEGTSQLDPDEKALLEVVALRWARGTPMTVRQAIAMANLGSPATLHKRLMRLRKREYLQLQNVSGDRRVKQLVPGAQGMAYLEEQGRHLLNSRQSPRRITKNETA